MLRTVDVPLDDGRVLRAYDSGADAAARITAGDVIRLWMDRPGSATRRLGAYSEGSLNILYEDAALIVLNKPA